MINREVLSVIELTIKNTLWIKGKLPSYKIQPMEMDLCLFSLNLLKMELFVLTKHEVAELFNVYPVTIASNITAIFKSGELFETEVMRISNIKGCNGKFVVYYNLDVIIALSFRMKGALCRLFREWIRERIKQPMWEGRQISILIQIGDKQNRDSAMN